MGDPTQTGEHRPARRIEELARAESALDGVRREDLRPGDRVIVATRNSIYSLTLLTDGNFEIAGGRFSRLGRGRARLRVAGCTAGGSALLTRIVAAPGLYLELEDGTRTTRIQRVRLLPATG